MTVWIAKALFLLLSASFGLNGQPTVKRITSIPPVKEPGWVPGVSGSKVIVLRDKGRIATFNIHTGAWELLHCPQEVAQAELQVFAVEDKILLVASNGAVTSWNGSVWSRSTPAKISPDMGELRGVHPSAQSGKYFLSFAVWADSDAAEPVANYAVSRLEDWWWIQQPLVMLCDWRTAECLVDAVLRGGYLVDDIQCVPNTRVCLATNGTTVYRRDDDKHRWKRLDFGTTILSLQSFRISSKISSLALHGETVVWASFDSGLIVKSNNLGKSWQPVFVPTEPKVGISDMHFFTRLDGVALGCSQTCLVYTIDGGASWLREPTVLGALYFLKRESERVWLMSRNDLYEIRMSRAAR